MTPEERVKARTEFKQTLTNKTEEELRALIEEITNESRDLDQEVSGLEYDIPTKGQKDAFDSIKYFLDKQKVQWNYALGLVNIYEFFDGSQKKITFAMLDTILRMLGSLEYVGYAEWKKVVDINDYFTPVAEQYRDVTDKIYDIAERYQMVEGQLKMFEPQPVENEVHELPADNQ